MPVKALSQPEDIPSPALLATLQQQIVEPIPTPPLITVGESREDEKPKEPDYSAILWRIYGLESSFGVHDSCREQGLYNGYGMNSNQTCYPSHEAATEVVNQWFIENLKMYSLSQAICRYNTGIPSSDCPYYDHYLAIVK